MQDQEIIALYFARDERAIEETANKYGKYCYKIAHNIVPQHEDAEECVSDTYFRAWNAMPPTRPTVLRLFLGKITRSLAINRYDYLHADKRGNGETAAVIDELAELVGGGSEPEKEFFAGELGKLIDAFVRDLPERDGNVFIRRYFYTESVSEIAKQYGLTETNASVILHRTRGKLQKFLAKEGYTL